jgi:hypothetical protein
MFPGGVTASISADVGYWWLGTSDSFYGVVNPPGLPNFTNGIPYKSYATWDAGLTLNWKKFSLDLRYYDTNLNKGDCNAFTSSQTASFPSNAFTPINPSGASSNWCSSAFVVKFSTALTLADLAPMK